MYFLQYTQSIELPGTVYIFHSLEIEGIVPGRGKEKNISRRLLYFHFFSIKM